MSKPTYVTAGSYRYRGYLISRGGFSGTSDDRLDGWYVDPVESDSWDRRGPGYATIGAAAEAIDREVECEEKSDA